VKSLIASKTFWVNALALTAMVFGSNELKAILPTDNAQATEIVVSVLAVVNIILRLLTATGISGILKK
jgi:hypothetical protein